MSVELLVCPTDGSIVPASSCREGGGGGRLYRLFESGYAMLGIPFTLEFLLVGVAIIIAVRYAVEFLATWLQAKLGANYVRSLKRRTFEQALAALEGITVLVRFVIEPAYATGEELAAANEEIQSALDCPGRRPHLHPRGRAGHGGRHARGAARPGRNARDAVRNVDDRRLSCLVGSGRLPRTSKVTGRSCRSVER